MNDTFFCPGVVLRGQISKKKAVEWFLQPSLAYISLILIVLYDNYLHLGRIIDKIKMIVAKWQMISAAWR